MTVHPSWLCRASSALTIAVWIAACGGLACSATLALGSPQDAGAPGTSSSDEDASKPTRHWYEVVVDDERLGVIQSQLESSASALQITQKWISFPDGQETTIDLESRYRIGRGGPVPEKLVVTVGVDAVSLQGVVDFRVGEGEDESGSWIETYRSGDDEPVKLRGTWSGETLLLPTTVPLLAPRLLGAPGETIVLYPAVPRSPDGPTIGALGAPRYRLTRSPVAAEPAAGKPAAGTPTDESSARTRFTLEGVDPSVDRRPTTCAFDAEGKFLEATWGSKIRIRPITFLEHGRWLREKRPRKR